MSFAITGKEGIVIYGAGERGKRFAELFCERGFYVRAVLDRERVEPLKLRGGGVISVVNPDRYVPDSREEIVVISLLNGRQHDSVAELLYQIGFEKIIYLPWKIEQNKKLMSDMRRLYNTILEGKCFLDNIPAYSDIVKDFTDDNLTDVDNVMYLPAENLFSAEESNQENMINSEVLLRLYHYLDKAEGDCTDYLKEQVVDSPNADVDRALRLKDRYKLYEYFEKAFRINREFFEDSAPRVIWNPHGYFQLGDGAHRTAFLIYKGMKELPVRIREEDRQYIELWKKVGGNFWCESPYLINREYSMFPRKLNEIFCHAMTRKDVFDKAILIILNDAGILARYCYHLRCALCIDVESTETFDFAKKIKDVFGFSERLKICMEANDGRDIDIAVLDEKYLDDNQVIQAHRYIIKLEANGMLHHRLKENQIRYEQLDKVFDGDKIYLVIQLENNEKNGGIIDGR